MNELDKLREVLSRHTRLFEENRFSTDLAAEAMLLYWVGNMQRAKNKPGTFTSPLDEWRGDYTAYREGALISQGAMRPVCEDLLRVFDL